MSVSWIEFFVVGTYLLFLVGIGIAFKRLNSNVDDYFRSGCQGTWWLVGVSSFMAGAGSGTFVSAAWTAYEHGFSTYMLMLLASIGPIIQALFLAKWFRQLRLITGPEVVRERYNVGLQQFYAYSGVVLALWGSGIGLWAVAIFCSSLFGLPVLPTVVVVGFIVLFYATIGGKWAVMGTDFIQGLIMVPITFLAAFLCLQKMGGIDGMLALVQAQGLENAWKPIKDIGQVEGNNFSWPFFMAFSIILTAAAVNLGAAQKYFAVKDGKSAMGSAWVFVVLYLLGGLLWAMPSFAGRLLFNDEVLALGLNTPGEGAFAVASREVLPLGLTGLMMTAILAAAMSTLDSGINGNAAMIVRDIYPAICRKLGWKPREGISLLNMSKVASLLLGILIMVIAFLLTLQQQLNFFDVFIWFNAILTLPMGIPLVMGLFIWKTPPWSGYVSIAAASLPSAYAFLGPKFFGLPALEYHEVVFAVFGIGVCTFLATMPFYKSSSAEYRNRVEAMYQRMHTPVDYAKEVGVGRDKSQLTIMGWFSLAVAAYIAALMIIPNPWSDRLLILAMAGFVAIIAVILILASGRAGRREAKALAAQALTDAENHPPDGGPLTGSPPR